MRLYFLLFGGFFAGIAGGFLIPTNIFGAVTALWIIFAGFLFLVDKLDDRLSCNDWFMMAGALTWFGGIVFFAVGWLCVLIKYLLF